MTDNQEHRRIKAEILAPAGSFESMHAAICAGADAVYMGGSRFGARAYADNPDEAQWLDAIDYAHLHGCKLYMTVNTLVKEAELSSVAEYLQPYYLQGLDAAIVQDIGVFSMIRRCFPELAIHASTQMTITGHCGAALLKEMGASRIVTARELSLQEIAKIRDTVDIEIESFVHGALCYCYSGQCLMSSFIGGRSGNRGRCAQPCRLPYDVMGDGGYRNRKDERYLLSLKDLSTLEILPDILEAGVYSLKIEGRMKSPRYTAGVVSVYRKYVDRYLQHGREGYRVDAADKKLLLDLFDRGGQTDGYYKQHNGREMVVCKEKPSFREGNQQLFDELDRKYIQAELKKTIRAAVDIAEGEPAHLTLECGGVSVTAEGAVAQTAQNQPLSEEKLRKQIEKTGGTPYDISHTDVLVKGACFLPVQALNELRRTALDALTQELLRPWRRKPADVLPEQEQRCDDTENMQASAELELHVLLEEPHQLSAALGQADVSEVMIDASGFGADIWQKTVRACHAAEKRCLLALPHIFRTEAGQYLEQHKAQYLSSGFDGVLIRSLEEVTFLQNNGMELPMVFDSGVYAMNHLAAEQFEQMGAQRLTLPLELNSRELEQLGCRGRELVGYGYLPVMVSAQCITKTISSCNKSPQILHLKDRMGKLLPVKNHCRFCYNTIYNTSPLSLLGEEHIVKRLAPQALRLQFSVETSEETEAVIKAFSEGFLHGRAVQTPYKDFTRGHLKRGVE